MSGGSGGGGGGGGGGFVPTSPIKRGKKPGSDDPCEIRITLPLSAVQPANAAKVSNNMILDVAVVTTNKTRSVVARLPGSNNVVGAIAYRDVQILIDCIEEGNEYGAKVINHSSTSVKVQISRK